MFNIGDVVKVNTLDKYDGLVGKVMLASSAAAFVCFDEAPNATFAFEEMEIVLKNEDEDSHMESHMESDMDIVELPVELYDMLTGLLVRKLRSTFKICFDSAMAGRNHVAESYGDKIDAILDDIDRLNEIRQVVMSDDDDAYFANMKRMVDANLAGS